MFTIVHKAFLCMLTRKKHHWLNTIRPMTVTEWSLLIFMDRHDFDWFVVDAGDSEAAPNGAVWYASRLMASSGVNLHATKVFTGYVFTKSHVLIMFANRSRVTRFYMLAHERDGLRDQVLNCAITVASRWSFHCHRSDTARSTKARELLPVDSGDQMVNNGAFQHEGHWFKSSYHRSSFPLDSLLLGFLENDVFCSLISEASKS